MLWNDLSFETLARLGSIAERATNLPAFLKRAAEMICNVTIDYNSKRKQYEVRRKWNSPLQTDLQLSLLGLHDFLYSLSWLLNTERTAIESKRTRPPLRTLCGKYIAPAENFTDLTFGEFLLAEDLLLETRDDRQKTRDNSREARDGREKLKAVCNILSVLYAPRTSGGLRVPITERDAESIATEIYKELNKKCSEWDYTPSGVVIAFLWWWDANLSVLQNAFPTLFLRNERQEMKETNGDQDRGARGLPSDLLYLLCDGDFTKLETIRNTNLWDAMRLLQTHLGTRY